MGDLGDVGKQVYGVSSVKELNRSTWYMTKLGKIILYISVLYFNQRPDIFIQ